MVCANPPIGQGIANGTACGTGTEMQQDQSCTSGYCNASNVCQAPPGNVTTGNTCHGGTTTAANGNCATGNTCDDYNAVSGTGVCRKVTGQSCQNKGECASDTCAALVPSGPKFCG
jgi:hypothetical protein